MGPTINTSFELMEAGSTQPAIAELTFMFKYKTPGKEGDYLPLYFPFPARIPPWNFPELYYLSTHFHSLHTPVVPQTVLHCF